MFTKQTYDIHNENDSMMQPIRRNHSDEGETAMVEESSQWQVNISVKIRS